MGKSLLTAAQVKEARRRVMHGDTIQSVADDFNVGYNVARNAVTGNSWSSIHNPPPVPAAVIRRNRRTPERICTNCNKRYRSRQSKKRCNACHQHWWRNGTERTDYTLGKWAHARLTESEIRDLYRRYVAGESMHQLARELPFGRETLRLRFIELGLPRRSGYAHVQQLTAAVVRHARYMAYELGIPHKDIAAFYDIHPVTMNQAINGHTWKDVGGLPATDGPKVACTNCGLLTTHPSRLCQYCR